MDDIQNYIGATGSITELNNEYKSNLEALGDEMKSKIKEFTDPIGSALMMEGTKGALTGAVNNFTKSLKDKGVDVDKIKDLVEAYRKGGVKGVVGHLKNNLGKTEEEEVIKGGEKNISDLSPEEWNSTKGTINLALKSRSKSFPENIQNSMSRKFQNVKSNVEDEPDENLRQQQNAQKINDIMDEQDQRTETLGDNLLKNPNVRNLVGGEDDDDSILNTAQRTFSGVAKKVSGLNEDAENLIKQNAKDLKPTIKEDFEKAVKRAGEEDLEEGGPEDIGGDVVSAVVGIGTFLGGVFGARKKAVPQMGNIQPANISYQSGV